MDRPLNISVRSKKVFSIGNFGIGIGAETFLSETETFFQKQILCGNLYMVNIVLFYCFLIQVEIKKKYY